MFKVFKTSGIEGNYSISSYPLFVNNDYWAIYPAKHKTTKKQYSVWQFQKKECESKLTNEGVINKSNKNMVMNDIIENIRLFIGNQAKLKHPNFVTVIEPLEDHKNRVLFVTENVISDLSNMKRAEFDEIMIMKGMLQICNGIKFLHESVKSVHLNINPSNILITENYDWKISGLSFLENISNGIIEKYIDPLDSRMPMFLSVDFRFSSPNLLIKHKVDFIDDLFSLCCLIYFLFNEEGYLISCSPSSSIAEYERQISKLNHTLKNINQNVKHATFRNIPDSFYSTFLEILSNCQESNTDVIQLKKQYTINDLMESPIFNNELIKALNLLDDYSSFSTQEKVNFLKTLKPQINKFPKPLLLNKFIPILVGSVDVNHYKKSNKPSPEEEELIVEVTDNLLLLSQSLSQLTFSDKIFPFISLVHKKTPFDSLKILLMKDLNIIATGLKSSGETFEKFSLDLLSKCINEKNSMIVQELALLNIKIVLEAQPYSVITNTILPEICTLYSTTTSLKIKTLTINTFIIMVSELDTKNVDDFIIVDKILPLIYKTSTAIFANSKFTTNLVTLYNIIFNKLSKSSTKSFSINGTETELYDIVMELGFNIWKIAKYVSNKQDLNIVYSAWAAIEKFLKHDLDSRLTSITPNRVFSSEVDAKVSNKLDVNKSDLTGSDFGMIMPKDQTAVKDFKVLTPTAKAGYVKNSETIPTLGFGQTVSSLQKPTAVTSSSNATIDWSKATSAINVMQPTARKEENVNLMAPMMPTSSFNKTDKTGYDNDEWGTFTTGNASKVDWGDSLI